MKKITAVLVALLAFVALAHSPSARAQVPNAGERSYPGGPGDSLIDLYVTVVVDPLVQSSVVVPRGLRLKPLAQADLPPVPCGCGEATEVIIDGPWDRFAAEDRAVQIVSAGLRHADESENRLYPANRIRLVEFRAHE